jgi:branched-chain amino acid transport system substrate-binding protein
MLRRSKEDSQHMKLRNLTALSGIALIAVAACGGSSTPTPAPTAAVTPPPATAASKGTVKIGVDLPLSGGEAPNGGPTLNGVKLAVAEANAAGGVNGYMIDTDVRDDAVNGQHNPDQGAANAQALVAEPDVIAMVGPFNSNVGAAEIPVTSAAGLLQCSPANTNPTLTKAAADGTFLRGTHPVSYVRVATTDDVQGPALADYLYTTLGKTSVFIVDDTETYGKGIADTFQARYEADGGTVTGRQGVANPDGTADYSSILTQAASANPQAVFFGGVSTTGGPKLRTQMTAANMGDLTFIGGDGIVDGDGNAAGSYINLAGPDAANSFGSVAAIHDIPNPDAFKTKYAAANNGDAPGAYSAPAYACTQIILDALSHATATDMAGLREAVRAYVTGGNAFDTALGSVTFDANGDTSQHIISFYKTDMTAAGGKGDWVFDQQQDFGGQ